jgi:hypothetical protein
MTDGFPWISLAVRTPQDREVVYARAKAGTPKKVVFYEDPIPRWIGANIVYEFAYFREWAPVEAEQRALDKTA